MIFISHRGNLHKPCPKLENKPSYIDQALNNEFIVEIDLWMDDQWYLGHDKPQYRMPARFWKYEKNNLIIHCKNSAALDTLSHQYNNEYLHYFWHQNDNYTITSQGKIWVYPNQKLLRASIAVLPEKGVDGDLNACWGICSDNIWNYRETIGQ